jgi:hypothetical protein
MDRHELTSKLVNGIHSITFTKVDGTERTMPCTLDPAILPRVEIKEEKSVPRKLNIETLRVFVTDIKEWRSFRIENVIKITSIGD